MAAASAAVAAISRRDRAHMVRPEAKRLLIIVASLPEMLEGKYIP
jgi:hypothetical protein